MLQDQLGLTQGLAGTPSAGAGLGPGFGDVSIWVYFLGVGGNFELLPAACSCLNATDGLSLLRGILILGWARKVSI